MEAYALGIILTVEKSLDTNMTSAILCEKKTGCYLNLQPQGGFVNYGNILWRNMHMPY